MPKFNDFDMQNWKSLGDIETDSLWIIDKRDNSGKNDGFYHGNFVPQIPRQLIKRYTKAGDVVLDPFVGSGTTVYEAETLGRNCIAIDLKADMVSYIQQKMSDASSENFFEIFQADSADSSTPDKVRAVLTKHNRRNVQLAVLHPPYFDIVKFSDNPNDLSNAESLFKFLEQFGKVVENVVSVLEKGRYLAIVIGDKYSVGQWYPLGFYCMQEAMRQGLTLKSVIVKNMDGNRGKKNQNSIWRYRALASDYYIFKHEYIFLLKTAG